MAQAADKTPADPRRAQVRARIARAHGHLHGILDMIDEDREYPEILQQIGAVRAALEKATAVIVEDMMDQLDSRTSRKDIEALRAAIRTLA